MFYVKKENLLLKARTKKFFEQIRKIEQEKQARFLLELEYEGFVYYLFHSSRPLTQKEIDAGFSPYFVIFENNNNTYISNGLKYASLQFNAIYKYRENKGSEVVFSKGVHNYIELGKYFIDGGFDYIRTNSSNDVVKVFIKDGDFYIDLGNNHIEKLNVV